MDLARIRELLKIVADSGVAEMELEEDGIKLVVRKNAATVTVQSPALYPPYGMGYAPAFPPGSPGYPQTAPEPIAVPGGTPGSASNAVPPAPAAPSVEASTTEAPVAPAEGTLVRAPIVGTFYEAPAPGADPFVKVGDRVGQGEVLCIIEAMKLMNEIENEVAGVIRQVLVQNGEPVEYDQPLYVIDPA